MQQIFMLDALAQPWVWITVAAAFAQNLRSLLQRSLTQRLSVQAASYVRFVYALPLAFAVVLAQDINPLITFQVPEFFGYAVCGAVAQIVGTTALVSAVSRGNFALGTALSKTEAAQAALFGLMVLGDAVTPALAAGIAISFVGVLLIQSPGSRLTFTGTTALAGLLAGTGFAISAVCFRGASLALPEGSIFERASLTVLTTLVIQTLLQGTYLALREPQQWPPLLRAAPIGLVVGSIGALASLGWFTAMTMENAARVRALGQIEILFTVATSLWWLREPVTLKAACGIALTVLGVLVLLAPGTFW